MDVERDGFLTTMDVSWELPPHGTPRRAADEERWDTVHNDLLRKPVVKNYNIMGVAKVALEAAVR